MKPLVLTIQAFGPFARTQLIDFRHLGDKTFFLIHGPTGSGKTSILDAMCFALFGDSSGGEREPREMRSQHADIGTPTEVSFDFAVGAERYRVRRTPEQMRKALAFGQVPHIAGCGPGHPPAGCRSCGSAGTTARRQRRIGGRQIGRGVQEACGITTGALKPPSPRMATGWQDCVVWLQRNYRFAAGSGIGRLAAAVNAGSVDDALQCLREGEDMGVVWHEQQEQGSPSAVLDVAVEGYRPYLNAVLSHPADSAAVAEAFGRFRVLCAQRQGPQGVEGLNEAITRHAREVLAPITSQYQVDSGSSWFPGRPVMVLVNDYAMKLFNGDIGMTLLGEDGALQVFFPLPEGGWRAIPPVRLPAHETAFAMTVHKSQGSEFGEVLLVLPGAESKVLTRELLYTGLMRARRRVQVMSTEQALHAAISRPTRRHTGLISRLREGAPTALFRKNE